MAETFEIDPAETFEIDAAPQDAAPQPAVQQAQITDALPPLARAGLGGAEAIGSVVSGGLGAALGGLVGGSHSLMYGADRGADVTRQIQEGMTYQPRTRAGQQFLGAAAALPQAYSENVSQPVADWSEERMGPAVGAATKAGMELLPSLIAKGAQGPARGAMAAEKSRLAGVASRNVRADETLARGQALGLKTVPESFAGQRVTSIAGKAATNQQAIRDNQVVVNRVSRKEAGLGPDDDLSPESFAKARDRIGKPYDEVAALSPRAQYAWDQVRETRRQAKLHWNHYKVGQDPKALAEAERLDARAEFLEKALDKEAIRLKRTDLLPRLKQARVAFAKNYDVENATNMGSGNVDPAVIGRAYDKAPGRYSGDLETIGRFHQAHKSVMKDASDTPQPGVSKLEAVSGAMLAGLGAGQFGAEGLALGALPLASHGARALALSKIMQPKRSYMPGLRYNLADIGTRRPELYMLAPTTGDQQK